MTNQKFLYAGVSTTPTGVTKARFGNDMVGRVKKLKDHTDVYFEVLPTEMTRAEAASYLLENERYNTNPIVKDALQKVVYRHVPKKAIRTV